MIEQMYNKEASMSILITWFYLPIELPQGALTEGGLNILNSLLANAITSCWSC